MKTTKSARIEIRKIEWLGYGRNPGYFIRLENESGSFMLSRSLPGIHSLKVGDTVRVEFQSCPGVGRGEFINSIEISA